MMESMDEKYMRRALQIARGGILHASPNPMVGAVIVAPDGRIIGEGFHRRCGTPHAEPNAIASVKAADRHLLTSSTMYVTLEPCSHQGRTPACSLLIIDTGIPRVVVGCLDPFARVNGRGVRMLREAGVEVKVGVLQQECLDINRRFITCHSLNRPWVTLKWAQTSDGFIDCRHSPVGDALRISTPAGCTAVHRLRAIHDAIAVGAGTVNMDNPTLTTRQFAGDSPRPVILGSSGLNPDSKLLGNPAAILISEQPLPAGAACTRLDINPRCLGDMLVALRQEGISSLLVEGGAKVIESFISQGLWDSARIEIADTPAPGDSLHNRVKAPAIPAGSMQVDTLGNSTIITVTNSTR